MKFTTKLTYFSSLAILSTSPLALADKAACHHEAPGVVACVEGDPICTEPVISDGNTKGAGGTTDGTVVDGNVDAGTIVEENTGTVTKDDITPTEGEVIVTTHGGEVIDPAILQNTTCDGTAVPLDWIKRGVHDNPDVIFYNMASGPAPVFKNETSPIAKQIGPDGKATAIEGKENAGAAQINREKKGPVALVKKGRVFLR